VTSPRLLAAVGLATALLLSGCGGGEKTGEGLIDPNKKLTAGPSCGLLGCQTTPPATKAPSAKPSPTQAVVKPSPTRPRVTTRPTQAAPKPFDIYLYGDKSGKNLIDPPQAAVYTGTRVVWHNADTKPHGVQAQNGAFASGNIPPGGTYTWVAGAPGMYAYQDSTRPYVNAQLQVAGR
jgi:plastocyanin